MKLAILDLYDGEPNQGMRSIKNIVSSYEAHLDEWKVYDVRQKAEVPDLSYDIYISSGGPGSPLDGDGVWNRKLFDFFDAVWEHNQQVGSRKKYLFFICHSFQMAMDHFDLARVLPRKSRAFGTFPAHKTQAGKSERYFEGLDDTFCVADFRMWQVVQPDYDRFIELGAKILLLEKERPHVPLERAIMAVRFSPEIFGTQFHPEADPQGMIIHFIQPENKKEIIEKHGKSKYDRMMDDLNDSKCIPLTFNTILPEFMDEAIEALAAVAV